jgi:hypothetical protein
LQATLVNSFSPTVGNSFNILSATSLISGIFATIDLPTLGSFLAWDQSQLYTTGTLNVISTLPGDYNGDGIVNAADYTVWRSALGQTVMAGTGADGDGDGMIDQGDYDFWSLHFGETVGSLPGAGRGAGVPEPSTFALAFLAMIFFAGRARSAATRRG